LIGAFPARVEPLRREGRLVPTLVGTRYCSAATECSPNALNKQRLQFALATCPRLAGAAQCEVHEAEVTASQLRTTSGERIGTGPDSWPERWILNDTVAGTHAGS
jgi:hypothetical protein